MSGNSLQEHLQEHFRKNAIWLAEEAAIDQLENDPFRAFSYQLGGF